MLRQPNLSRRLASSCRVSFLTASRPSRVERIDSGEPPLALGERHSRLARARPRHRLRKAGSAEPPGFDRALAHDAGLLSNSAYRVEKQGICTAESRLVALGKPAGGRWACGPASAASYWSSATPRGRTSRDALRASRMTARVRSRFSGSRGRRSLRSTLNVSGLFRGRFAPAKTRRS